MDNIDQTTNFSFVRDFYRNFAKANLYLVGGSLRDALLAIESSDFDLVAEGVSQADLIGFLEKEGKVVSIEGRTFGVIKFMPNEWGNKPSLRFPLGIDIALPRREMYLAGMRRKNATVELKNVTIYDDLARRDFTINAMALPLGQSGMDYKFSELRIMACLIDPFHGLDDLDHKILRAVGDPRERFLEDPTRILRGIRFAVKFNLVIESKTKAAMIALAPEISKTFMAENGQELPRVSGEMIGQEFLKTFEIDPAKTIKLYDEIGLLSLLFPEIKAMQDVSQPPQFHIEGDVYTHSLMALENLPAETTLALKLATLLHDIGKPATFRSSKETGDRIRFNDHDRVGADIVRQLLRRLKFPNNIIDDTSWLVANHMKLPFSFPRMRKDKQKRFARERLFPQLLQLVLADARASIWAEGKFNLHFLPPVEKVLRELEEDKREEKPVEIINGDEIIAIIKETNPSFDPQKQGKLVGTLKKKINSMYDRGEIGDKSEALETVRGFLGKNNPQD